MLDMKATCRALAIGFTIGSLITGFCAYLYFSDQFEWLDFGVFRFNINGYIFPILANRLVMGCFYLFDTVLFLIAAVVSCVGYLVAPGNLTPDYEQYL
jgi:hypothetical protein